MPRTDLANIYARVQSVAERDDVEEFAIGTTLDLARTQAALRAEDIVSIYEADAAEDAADVEEALLAHFSTHAKCASEDAYEPDTSTLGGDSVLSVFVAIWWAS
jgi:hypothetical protein